MRRPQVEALLRDASASEGQDFHITVPYEEVSAVLTILKHLEASGQFDRFARREAEASCEGCQPGYCGCIDIYGYTG